MQRLDPARNSDRHFLVPLPPNTDPASPELFSFFTYEIRVGHGRGHARPIRSGRPPKPASARR